jgi:hypothetical protein
LADSSTNENEKSTKEMDGDSNSRISDHGIYCDSLDEKSSNDGITEPKKKEVAKLHKLIKSWKYSKI